MILNILGGFVFGPAATGQDRPPRAPSPAFVEITPEVQGVIDRGLAFLAARQIRSPTLRGAWEGQEYTLPVTALAGLALLASGSTPTSGPYAENIERAIDFVLRCRGRSGIFRLGNDSRPMYGHGFATLFLAECYGMGVSPRHDRAARDALRDAVDAIGRSQSKDGGWYYTPGALEDEGSVTITQIQALRAARNAGIKVEKRVIDRAIEYIRNSQDPDGGVRYTVRYGRSSLALTAAGLSVLHGAGDYDSDNVKRALDYVRGRLHSADGGEGWGDANGHFQYTHFYAAQALFQHGGLDWEHYFPRIRAALLRSACDDRSRYCYWEHSQYGVEFATAFSLLILEIPYRYLPIYER